MFDNTVCRQKIGVAMRTKTYTVLANLTMSYLELVVYQESLTGFENPVSHT